MHYNDTDERKTAPICQLVLISSIHTDLTDNTFDGHFPSPRPCQQPSWAQPAFSQTPPTIQQKLSYVTLRSRNHDSKAEVTWLAARGTERERRCHPARTTFWAFDDRPHCQLLQAIFRIRKRWFSLEKGDIHTFVQERSGREWQGKLKQLRALGLRLLQLHQLTMKFGPVDSFWHARSSLMQSSVVMWSSVDSSRTPHLMSTTWNS